MHTPHPALSRTHGRELPDSQLQRPDGTNTSGKIFYERGRLSDSFRWETAVKSDQTNSANSRPILGPRKHRGSHRRRPEFRLIERKRDPGVAGFAPLESELVHVRNGA